MSSLNSIPNNTRLEKLQRNTSSLLISYILTKQIHGVSYKETGLVQHKILIQDGARTVRAGQRVLDAAASLKVKGDTGPLSFLISS